MTKWFFLAAAIIVLAAPCALAADLMSPEALQAVRAALPRVQDEELTAIFRDPTTTWYTNAEIPPAYQFARSGVLTNGVFSNDSRATFLAVGVNISGGDAEARKGNGFGGNGNIEFPWRTAGGLDAAERETHAIRFLHLPKGRPVAVYRDTAFMPTTTSGGRIVGGHNQLVLKWVYPVGATLGEVLFLQEPGGSMHAFEVRTRTKADRGKWEVDIFRPFPTARDLAAALEERGEAALAERVLSSRVVERSLVDRSHPTEAAFATTAAVDELPAMPAPLVQALLSAPYRSTLGKAWKSEGGAHCFAPTSSEGFSLVPPGYQGTFLGTDSASCMNCHQHTLSHVNKFAIGRDWYGFVRGSDGIFSFHPVEPSSVSYRNQQLEVRIRAALVDAGVVAPYNREQHPASLYQESVP